MDDDVPQNLTRTLRQAVSKENTVFIDFPTDRI
jgi:hypothetical protein